MKMRFMGTELRKPSTRKKKRKEKEQDVSDCIVTTKKPEKGEDDNDDAYVPGKLARQRKQAEKKRMKK
jgi:hypothetical protein